MRMILIYAHLYHTVTNSAPPLGSTESDWIRRVGVFIGLTGAVIAAWNGAAWLVREIRDFVTKWWRKSRGQLAYLWLRLRHKPTTRHVTDVEAAGAMSMSSAAKVRASGFVWHPAASADGKADVLHREIIKVHECINELDQTVRTSHAEVKALVEVQVSEVRKAHRELEAILAAKERHEIRADGRGLILVAAGIVLTGIPGELARYPAGWTITALAVCLTAVVVRGVIREIG
jgi:hypothetical protein